MEPERLFCSSVSKPQNVLNIDLILKFVDYYIINGLFIFFEEIIES